MLNTNGYMPSVPIEVASVGVDLGGNIVVPPGGRVFFVRGNGTTVTQYADDQTDPYMSQFTGKLLPSVEAALALCTANRGDRIIVHPRHTQNIANGTTFSNALVAGVKIIGLGVGTERPTFTFSEGASKITINAASVGIYNCRFLCAGPPGTTAITVAAPFAATAANVCFSGNYFQAGIDVDQFCQAFLTTTAAATGFNFSNNEVESLDPAALIVSGVTLTGVDGAKIINNVFYGSLSATTMGWVRIFTTACRNVTISGNRVTHTLANSTVGIDLTASLANSGIVALNRIKVGTGTAPFGAISATMNVMLEDNYVFNGTNTRGLIVGTAAA